MTHRILYLSTHNPSSEAYGASLRAMQIGQALSQMGSVKLVIVSREGGMPL